MAHFRTFAPPVCSRPISWGTRWRLELLVFAQRIHGSYELRLGTRHFLVIFNLISGSGSIDPLRHAKDRFGKNWSQIWLKYFHFCQISVFGWRGHPPLRLQIIGGCPRLPKMAHFWQKFSDVRVKFYIAGILTFFLYFSEVRVLRWVISDFYHNSIKTVMTGNVSRWTIVILIMEILQIWQRHLHEIKFGDNSRTEALYWIVGWN